MCQAATKIRAGPTLAPNMQATPGKITEELVSCTISPPTHCFTQTHAHTHARTHEHSCERTLCWTPHMNTERRGSFERMYFIFCFLTLTCPFLLFFAFPFKPPGMAVRQTKLRHFPSQTKFSRFRCSLTTGVVCYCCDSSPSSFAKVPSSRLGKHIKKQY